MTALTDRLRAAHITPAQARTMEERMAQRQTRGGIDPEVALSVRRALQAAGIGMGQLEVLGAHMNRIVRGMEGRGRFGSVVSEEWPGSCPNAADLNDEETTKELAHTHTLRHLYATYHATANVEAKEALRWLCERAGVGMEGWEG